MERYFFEADGLAFQFNALRTLQELKFRLKELSAVCREAIEEFHIDVRERRTEKKKGIGPRVQFRFSSVLGLIQTLKDVLPNAIPGFDFDSLLASTTDGNLVQNIRNAVIHDGQEAVTMYADGQYFIAVDIRRKGRGRSVHEIAAPSVDVETFALQFYEQVSQQLIRVLDEMPQSAKLRGRQFSMEWMRAAVRHPNLARFKLEIPEPMEFPDKELPRPLDDARGVLLEIELFCRARLAELSQLPKIPF
jgi:hypothetical protein